jgi:hypothetical protein
MGKFLAVAAGAIGYVLGARAGRERYEQIKSQANRLRQDPKVQQAAARAEGLAKDRLPPKIADAASKATEAARSTTGRDGHTTTEGASGGPGSESPGSEAPAGDATRG